MNSKKLFFTNRAGSKLVARLDTPVNQKIKACALFAHCFTCGKNLSAVRNISRALTLEGIAVFRFDFSGLGESEGDFADTNFSSNVEDLIDAAAFMGEQLESPSIIIGHSLGGAAVLFATEHLPSIKAVITIGAPASPQHLTHLFEGQLHKIEENGVAEVSIGGRSFNIKKQFVDDLMTKSLPRLLSTMRTPLLIMHAPQDTTVGIGNAKEIYQAAHHPKSFVSLDGADHLLTDKKDSLYVGSILATWVKKYLDLQPEEELTTDKQVVVNIDQSHYTSRVATNNHQFLADEPPVVGGKGLGPSPFEFLLSALGSCTVMTLRMYADRKKWDLQEVTAHLSYSKENVRDTSGASGKIISQFDLELEIEGNLTPEQKNRLLEIANKCPVHKTLIGEVEVEAILRG